MKRTVVMMMVLSGLSFLPACFPRFYQVVKRGSTWDEAQTYCRSSYTDLAVFQTQQELNQLDQLTSTKYLIWIGLRPDTEAWTWSSQSQNFYSAGEAGFRMWAPGEPNGLNHYKVCVSMMLTGEWSDVLCSSKAPFVCYNDRAGTQTSSSNFILVTQSLNWTDAQSFCRVHYTDLASVRNQAENDQVKMIIQTDSTWIGLYRDSWRWSDGSPVSVSNWYTGYPSTTTSDTCVIVYYSKWKNADCTNKGFFACLVVPVRKQVVQVVLTGPDSSVDMEQLKENMIQKFNQNLKNQILSEEVRLSWMEHPDGKVFYRKTTEEKRGESCPFR